MGRGYGLHAATQLVGNRYRLNKRQRLAMGRCSASEQQLVRRQEAEARPTALKGQTFYLDGFNQLIVLESLLSGAFVFRGRDGAYRDLAGVHGSYKRVRQTRTALLSVGKALRDLQSGPCCWVLDRPVSNSGRLGAEIQEVAAEQGFDWSVELLNNPDRRLIGATGIVISSDSEVLDQVDRWFNLIQYLLDLQPDLPRERSRILTL